MRYYPKSLGEQLMEGELALREGGRKDHLGARDISQ